MSTPAHLALAHTINMYASILAEKDQKIQQQQIQIKSMNEEIARLKEPQKEKKK